MINGTRLPEKVLLRGRRVPMIKEGWGGGATPCVQARALSRLGNDGHELALIIGF